MIVVVSDVEHELIAALLLNPQALPDTTHLGRYDFTDPRLGCIFETLGSLHSENSEDEISATDLAVELDANGDLERCGGRPFLAELLQIWPGPVNVPRLATAVLVGKHKREQMLLLERAVGTLENGGLQHECLTRLEWLTAEIAALEAGTGSPSQHDPSSYIFLGRDRFDALQAEPEPAWIVDPMLREGTVTLLGVPPFTGKTRFSVWLSMCLAAGLDPWEGASTSSAAPVIYVGYDTHASARTLRSTAYTLAAAIPAEHGPTRLELRHNHAWQNRFAIVGNSKLGGAFPVERYRLDEEGIANIRRDLIETVAEQCGERPRALVTDTFSTALPLDTDENDNAALNALLTRLGGLALEEDLACLVVHHPSKGATRKDFDPDDPGSYFRGASSMVGAVGIAAGLWAPRDEPQNRALTRWTNYGGMQRQWFEVCSEERSEGRWIDYWAACDSPSKQAEGRLDVLVPGDILERNEEINMTTLGERLIERGTVSSKRSAERYTARLRSRWEAAGDVEVRDGPRGSILIRGLF